MSINPWATHRTENRYENAWILVEHNEVTTPGGTSGVYGVVRFKNRAVGIVPIDADDHTWLVGQYRYALDEYSWEIPAGGCPVGDSLEDTARRELREETGLIASTLRPVLAGVRLTNSVTDETAWSYIATDLEPSSAQPDDTEELELRRIPVAEAIELVLDHKISDAFTIMTLLRIHADRIRS